MTPTYYYLCGTACLSVPTPFAFGKIELDNSDSGISADIRIVSKIVPILRDWQ
jgi:hypothetical protein